MAEKFGDLIRRLRIEQGLTIEELAKKSDYTVVQIRNIEKNKYKPRVFNLTKLSNALNSNYEYLFDKLNEK